MGDIIVSLKAGPFSEETSRRLKESLELNEFLARRAGEISTDPDDPRMVWLEASDDCDDAETDDALRELLLELVGEGETFSIEQDTFMIGHMGLDEDSCGTRITFLKVGGGKLQELSYKWVPQDFD